MERFVQEVSEKLLHKFSAEDVVKIREILYVTFKDYDVIPKKNEIMVANTDYQKELNIYLASLEIEGKQKTTIKQYRQELTKFLPFVNKPIKEIKSEDIRLYLYEAKLYRHYSDATMERKRSYITPFFSWLYNNEYIDKNPCIGIKPFKCEKKLKKSLTDIELVKVRNACKNKFEKAVVEVLYSTACRVTELTNIKLSDIDYFKKEVNIIQGKGNKSRITFLNADAIIAIEEYVKDRDYPTLYLFEASRKPHNKLSARTIEKTCHSLEQRTGIRLYPHKMRRTTATNLWKKGMPIEEIKEMLGHDEVTTTLRYTMIDNESVKKDFQKYI